MHFSRRIGCIRILHNHTTPPLCGIARDTTPLQLLDAGADIDVTDKAGMTPLHFAAQMGQRATAELLLQRRANPFLIVTRGIHKGRLAIDFASSSRAQDLNKALAEAMSNR